MLDISQIAGSFPEAARRARARQAAERADADRAGEVARAFAPDDVAARADRFRAALTSWLTAYPVDPAAPPGRGYPAAEGALPPAHVVLAADGSQIAPDRHDAALRGCCVLNVGRVLIPYGVARRPRMDAVAEVVLVDEDAADEAPGDEDGPASTLARTLGLRRFAREMAALQELIHEAADTGLPAVALTDGSLIAWALEDETGQDPAKQAALAALLSVLETARERRVPLAGYVSGPGSRDVVNGLRVAALCPEDPADCARCPHPADALPCAPIRRATDAALYARLLAPGERSAVFASRGQATGYSRVLRRYGDDNWPGIFYLNVGAEVARVELPLWAAEDSTLLERVHAVCLDQARKGRGYPVALAEAHEQAVVRAADRQAFRELLLRAMVREGEIEAADTRKAVSKRVRSL